MDPVDGGSKSGSFADDGLVRVSFPGHEYTLHGHQGEYVRSTIERWGLWEPRLTRVIDQILGAGDPKCDGVFVDCGAHIGYYTLLAAQHGYRAIAVEPLYHREIERAAAENGVADLVEIRPVAVGGASSTCIMRRYGETGLSQVVVDDAPPSDWHRSKSREIEQVDGIPMVTLDSIVGRRPIRILKIDVEGLEPAVLDGFSQGLRRRLAHAILLEVTPRFLGVEASVTLARRVVNAGYAAFDVGIVESGEYEESDVIGGLQPLDDSDLRSVLAREPQTNLLFVRAPRRRRWGPRSR